MAAKKSASPKTSTPKAAKPVPPSTSKATKPSKATKKAQPGATQASKKSTPKPTPEASVVKAPAKKSSGATTPVTPKTSKAAARSAANADPHLAALLELRQLGLSYPETHMKSPWPDHMDLAVRNKTFAYLSPEGQPLSISCKLPESCQTALSLPFASPTGYGLGKSGWVTATFSETDTPPVEFLKTWLEESYRAVAPKTLAKQLPPR